MLLSEKETRKAAANLMRKIKASDAVVTVRSVMETNQRFAGNAFTTNGRIESVTAEVTVWIEGRRGSASTSDFSSSSLAGMVEEAQRIARLSPVDQEYVPTLRLQKYRPVKSFHHSTADPSAGTRARELHRVLQLCEEAKVIGAGLHRTVAAATGSLTQHGNWDFEASSSGSLAMTARLPDGSSSGYFLRSANDLNELDTAHIAREAIRRAVEGRGAQVLAPGVYPVILEAQAVSDILSFLPGAFSARPADEGRSAMSAPEGKTKLGKEVFDSKLNYYSDPWHPNLPGSQSGPDGLPAEKLFLVRNGVVENLVYPRYWAKEKNRAPTPGPVNYIMEGVDSGHALEAMIGNTERALLVTRLWYIRMVDPRQLLVTGLTRDGVWLVENGKIKHAVRNFRFNQSLMQMLAPGNVDAVGKSERVGGSGGPGSASLYPALKLKRFHFTSASEAV